MNSWKLRIRNLKLWKLIEKFDDKVEEVSQKTEEKEKRYGQ